MGIYCCKSSGDFPEIKFSTTTGSRIKTSNNINKTSTDDKIKINITNSNGYSISMIINHNLLFGELKKKYCEFIGKTKTNRLVFLYKGKVLEENESLFSMGIFDEITVLAFDGNDYK